MWLSTAVMQVVFGRRAASALGTHVTTKQLTMDYEALRYGMLQTRAPVQLAEIVPCCNSGDCGALSRRHSRPHYANIILIYLATLLDLVTASYTFKKRASTPTVSITRMLHNEESVP